MAPELEEVRAWILRADHDRLAAKLGLQQSPPLSDIAAFHAQQAVEKLLQAFLVFKGVQFEKVHDLAQLTDDCGKVDEAFLSFKASVAPLSAYAVRFRYPGPTSPSIGEVESAMQVVESVWGFVLDRLPLEVRS